ncbi:DUF4383 domain-containing protein [Actinophytocola sp.]|uniref:DUF4383 domain-containing protein n=1 Tax=Actinophytocola sp. TaxID=1872138 RepID=UPI002DBB4224|nr:DUF4383 domain-containing protein [Actinophytocola sp.]
MRRPHRRSQPEQPGSSPVARTTAPVQHAAATVGVAFGLLGLLGFLPGFTSNIGALAVAGPGSGAMLLGVFSVSVLHNLVHVLFAVAGLALSRTPRSARGYLFAGGAIYLLLALYGALVDQNGAANFVPVNTADDWLHLGIGALMIGLGLLPGGSRTPPPQRVEREGA